MMSSAVANHHGLKNSFGDYGVHTRCTQCDKVRTPTLPKEALNQQQFPAVADVIPLLHTEQQAGF